MYDVMCQVARCFLIDEKTNEMLQRERERALPILRTWVVMVCVFAACLWPHVILEGHDPLAVFAMPRIVNQFMNVAYVAGNLTLVLATEEYSIDKFCIVIII